MILVLKNLGEPDVKTVPFSALGRSTAFRDNGGNLAIKFYLSVTDDRDNPIVNAVTIDEDGDVAGTMYKDNHPCIPLPDLAILTREK